MTAQVHQFPTDADRLATIAKEIQRELTDASNSALESAIRIGERLIEAKKLAGHGKFIPWLEQNFHAGRKQATRYMSAARHAEKLRANVSSEATFKLDTIPALLALPGEPDDSASTSIQSDDLPKKHRNRTSPKYDEAKDAYDKIKASGVEPTRDGVMAAAGVSKYTADLACNVRRAEAALVAPEQEPPPLSLSGQQKLDLWRKKLESDFESRVDQASRERSQQWLNDVRIPIYEEKIAKLVRMLEWPSNTVMTKAEYNIVMKCLHPDGIKSRSEEQLAEAFRIFTKYRPKLASDEEIRKAVLRDLPRSRDELLARKKAKL